jgi:hypothetical protein
MLCEERATAEEKTKKGRSVESAREKVEEV